MWLVRDTYHGGMHFTKSEFGMPTSMKKLTEQLNDIESLIPEADQTAPDISSVSVGWHLDHSLRVINGICKQLHDSDPSAYQPRFSWGRWYVFLRNRIPRGAGKAPKSVTPEAPPSREGLEAQLKTARYHLRTFDSLPANSHFPHPYFGDLKRDAAHRFLRIHTDHHLRIVREIQAHK